MTNNLMIAARPGLKELILSEFKSLHEFAEYLGYHQSTLSNIFKYKNSCNKNTALDICYALEKNFDDLFVFTPVKRLFLKQGFNLFYKDLGYTAQSFSDKIGIKRKSLHFFQSGNNSISEKLAKRIFVQLGNNIKDFEDGKFKYFDLKDDVFNYQELVGIEKEYIPLYMAKVEFKKVRNEKNLTMQDLADYCGVSRAMISYWENNVHAAREYNAKLISEILGKDIDYLFELVD